MIKLMKDCSGSMFVYVLIILAFLFSFSGIISEIYRIHSIQTHVEYELQRAVNCAVEEAMYDSWRQDKLNHLDTASARQDFNNYLSADLGLNGSNQKHNDGRLIYSIQFTQIESTEEPPRMRITGNILIPTNMPILVTGIEVPFNIASKNARID